MYETEANQHVESLDQIPPAVQARFRELDEAIISRTLIPWGEHCTECVWPTCYTTCDLYMPREDLRCRRFVDGMVRIECPGTPNSYLLKISFKRWGKLWAPGNVHLFDRGEASRRERWDNRIGKAIYQFPLPVYVRKEVSGKRYLVKNALSRRRRPTSQAPTAFLVECYNPASFTMSISLTMRPTGEAAKMPFQRLLELPPGFARFRIPIDAIGTSLVSAPFDVELTPNDIADGATVYFGVVDFVSEKPKHSPLAEPKPPLKVKCVVWDLDNTIWDGTFVEDGAATLRVKSGVVGVIRELDRRGILHSVASKNTYEEVWPVVESAGLAEYFLFPQVSWMPKGAAVEAIAKKLNIGLDTLLFVDDSTFELEQVRAACPDVRVVHASEALFLPSRPDCDVPATAEAAVRRQMYQQESVRQESSAAFDGDYLSFLRDCRLELTLKPLARSNLARVHELTQRTNQMNFSGTRYDKPVLEQILSTEHLDTYVLECRDRFGSYGIVGFAIVDRREPRMTDLMFSCRVQSKRVEHAFLMHLFQRYSSATGLEFWANYRKTSKNAPSGQVFAEVGMQEVETRDGVTSLVYKTDRQVFDDGIVTVRIEGPGVDASEALIQRAQAATADRPVHETGA